MIIRFDGFKIYPPAIEDVVSTHEGVKACAVVGIKDKEIGRVPIVYVELTDNYSGDIKTEVLSLCKEKLAERAVPYDVRVIDSIPMTLMGKVDFIALENM